jgi:hypothetical protein
MTQGEGDSLFEARLAVVLLMEFAEQKQVESHHPFAAAERLNFYATCECLRIQRQGNSE